MLHKFLYALTSSIFLNKVESRGTLRLALPDVDWDKLDLKIKYSDLNSYYYHLIQQTAPLCPTYFPVQRYDSCKSMFPVPHAYKCNQPY